MLRFVRSHLCRTYVVYDTALKRTPIRTKLVTSLCLTLLGDGAAQAISHQQHDTGDWVWDNERTGRQMSWSVVGLPVMHLWYNLLHRVPSVPVRIAMDQFLYSPPIIACYFGYLGIRRGLSFEEVQEEVSQKLMPTMLVNWAVWIPVQTINMSHLVPLRYRVLVANCVGFNYGIFLSYTANSNSQQERGADQGKQ